MTVSDVWRCRSLSEFDTNKALYELLTRDLIEEVRGPSAAAVLAQATPVDETGSRGNARAAAARAVPGRCWPGVAGDIVQESAEFLRSVSSVEALAVAETRKAISMQRIETLGQGVDSYNDIHGQLPVELKELSPHYIVADAAARPVGQRVQVPPHRRALPRHRLHRRRQARHGSLPRARARCLRSVISAKPQTGGIRLDRAESVDGGLQPHRAARQ